MQLIERLKNKTKKKHKKENLRCQTTKLRHSSKKSQQISCNFSTTQNYFLRHIMKNINLSLTDCAPTIKDVSYKDVVIIGKWNMKCVMSMWFSETPIGEVFSRFFTVSHQLVTRLINENTKRFVTSGFVLVVGFPVTSINL